MSQVSYQEYKSGDTKFIEVRAVGGSRRERGSATGALIRKLPGKWVRYYTTYSETQGFDRATYTKYQCTEVPAKVKYLVHTGQPSWHQARAGAISSGIVSFGTKEEAEQYLEKYKASHPGEVGFILEQA